jgi:hypothetical protein
VPTDFPSSVPSDAQSRQPTLQQYSLPSASPSNEVLGQPTIEPSGQQQGAASHTLSTSSLAGGNHELSFIDQGITISISVSCCIITLLAYIAWKQFSAIKQKKKKDATVLRELQFDNFHDSHDVLELGNLRSIYLENDHRFEDVNPMPK